MSDDTTSEAPSNAGPHEGGGASGSLWRWIFVAFSQHIGKLVVAAILAGAVGAFWTLWNVADAKIRSFIVSTVASDLSSENGKLTLALKKAEARIGELDAGAVSVGSFELNNSIRSHTIYVYLPEGYKAELYYSL